MTEIRNLPAIGRRLLAVLAVVALVFALIAIAVPEPATAVVWNHGLCSASGGNGDAGIYYWAATESTDYDCSQVKVGFHWTGQVSDMTYPYNADKVSTSEPSGDWSVHKLYNAIDYRTKYLSYTW